MDANILELANMIYSEGASTDYDTMVQIGSTAVNRLHSNRDKEFGATMYDVIHNPNAYPAVRDKNIPYQQATTGKFPDTKSEKAYKQAVAVASGLWKGSIEPKGGHFYFTEDEITKLKKKGKKVFDFSKVKEVGKANKYRVFSY
jgi:hypothetical protein